MKIKATDGHEYEVFRDGKPIENEDPWELGLVFLAIDFPYILMGRWSHKDEIRALTFAQDAEYVNKVLACVEGEIDAATIHPKEEVN